MSDKFNMIEQQLELFIENSRQLGIIVSDYQTQGKAVLSSKLNTMVVGMQEIDKIKTQFADVQIPLQVFDYIDQGKNPQLYTKDCMEKALAKNEAVKGKIDALKRFQHMLMAELIKVFPEEMAKYKKLYDGRRKSS